MKVRTNINLCPELWKFAIAYGKPDDRSGSYLVNKLLKEFKAKHTKVKKKAKPPAVVENAIMWIPLNTGEFPVIPADVNQWQMIYPAVDVEAELRAMVGWCDANPTKKKTNTGIKKFINAWLKRAQDKGGLGFNAAATKNDNLNGEW